MRSKLLCSCGVQYISDGTCSETKLKLHPSFYILQCLFLFFQCLPRLRCCCIPKVIYVGGIYNAQEGFTNTLCMYIYLFLLMMKLKSRSLDVAIFLRFHMLRRVFHTVLRQGSRIRHTLSMSLYQLMLKLRSGSGHIQD